MRTRGFADGARVSRRVVIANADHLQAGSESSGNDRGRRHLAATARRQRGVHVKICPHRLHGVRRLAP